MGILHGVMGILHGVMGILLAVFKPPKSGITFFLVDTLAQM